MNSMIQKIYDALFIVFFLLIISVPLIAAIVSEEKKWSVAEKRVLEVFPSSPTTVAEVFSFPEKFEKYYNDHFGFRELMISRYHKEMGNRFDVAGTPLVIKGQKKWLFFTGNDMLEDFRGEFVLSDQELTVWQNKQQIRQKWLEERGIQYLSFSPPNKHTVYPEFLPKEYLKSKGISRMEQLHKFVADNPLPSYVNVFDVIKKSKTLRKLYYKTDTHWNHYGAYVCFREVMAKVQQVFPDEKFTVDFHFHRNSRLGPGGDLAGMLMIDKRVLERYPKMRQRNNCSEKAVIDFSLTEVADNKYEKPLLTKCSKAKLNAIVFCDSFVDYLEPFFSENFNQILYLRKGYDQRNVEEVLENFQPDIVFEERVERNFFETTLKN